MPGLCRARIWVAVVNLARELSTAAGVASRQEPLRPLHTVMTDILAHGWPSGEPRGNSKGPLSTAELYVPTPEMCRQLPGREKKRPASSLCKDTPEKEALRSGTADSNMIMNTLPAGLGPTEFRVAEKTRAQKTTGSTAGRLSEFFWKSTGYQGKLFANVQQLKTQQTDKEEAAGNPHDVRFAQPQTIVFSSACSQSTKWLMECPGLVQPVVEDHAGAHSGGESMSLLRSPWAGNHGALGTLLTLVFSFCVCGC